MKEVQITPLYKIREDGRIFNVKTGKERIVSKQRCGYYIEVNGKNKFVHQVVMELFGLPCPGKEYRIRHINNDNYDNRIENLEWATISKINSDKKSSLPVGQRRCDFEDKNEYNRLRYKRRHEKYGNSTYWRNREARLASAKKYRETHHEQVLEKTRKWREENKEYVKQKNKEKYEAMTPLEREILNNRRRERYEKIPEVKRKHIESNIQFSSAHPEEVRLYHKAWREKNREKINKRAAESRIKHREKHLEACKRWYEEHKEHVAELGRLRRAENPEKYRESARLYREKHREELNAKARQKRAENPEYFREKHNVWNHEHPEELNEYCRKYRAKKKAKGISP